MLNGVCQASHSHNLPPISDVKVTKLLTSFNTIKCTLQVMLTMFEEITEPTLCQLCTVERLPFAGHMIAIALTYAHKCASKDVKLTALQFLQVRVPVF